jgi:hypothetical protein
MRVAEFDEAGAFRMFSDASFEADSAHLVEAAAGWAHGVLPDTGGEAYPYARSMSRAPPVI